MRYDHVVAEADTPPDLKRIGPASSSYKQDYSFAMTWASQNLDPKQRKQEALKWLEGQNVDTTNLKHLPDYEFRTIGKLGWILNNGGDLDPQTITWFRKKADELANKTPADPEPTSDTESEPEDEQKISKKAQDNLLVSRLMAPISSYVRHGNFEFTKLDELFKKVSPREGVIKQILNDMGNLANLVKGSKDKKSAKRYNEVIELLRNWSKKTSAIKTSKKVQKIGKELQKAKSKPKLDKLQTKMAQAKLSDLPKEFSKVEGAKGLLTYQPETRILQFFPAKEGGLMTSGPKITNYDLEKAWKVKIKNPEKTLEKLKRIKFENAADLAKIFGPSMPKKDLPRPTIKAGIDILKLFN